MRLTRTCLTERRFPRLSQPSCPFRLSRRGNFIALAGLEVRRNALKVLREEVEELGLPLFQRGNAFEPGEEVGGDRFVAVEIDSSKGNPHGHPSVAHSVLTEHLIDEPGPTRDALEQVLELFRSRLLAPAA